MPTNRNVVFANGEYYHIFNRGVERRPVFTTKRDYIRAVETLKYYQYSEVPVRLSKYLLLTEEDQQGITERINKDKKLVEITAYCLMKNHFHLLLQQKQEKGISKFMAHITNSYTKYFNGKQKRVGPLFQGIFKAVHIETDEQLMHVSRYIHLNPVASYAIKAEELEGYYWSSYPEYLKISGEKISTPDPVLELFSKTDDYKRFVLDQVNYARELEKIKHLIFE